MSNARRLVRHYGYTIALIVLAGATSFLFVRIQQTRDDAFTAKIEQGTDRINDLTVVAHDRCQSEAELRLSVIHTVEQLTPPIALDPKADQATQDRITKSNADRAAALNTVREGLKPPDCSFTPPPVPPPGG